MTQEDIKNQTIEETDREEIETKEKIFSFGIKPEDLVKAGVCFGHERGKLHPKMEPFVAGIRRNVYIIDPFKTAEYLERALRFLQEIRSEGGTVLLVDTRVEHQEQVRETANLLGLPYVVSRWLGGTLTNFSVMKERVKVLQELEEKLADEKTQHMYTKKEINKMKKELEDLKEKFEGIRTLDKLPDVVFIFSLAKDELPAREASKTGVKSVAIVDTNANPELVDYPIPGNDEAPSSITYILERLKTALG